MKPGAGPSPATLDFPEIPERLIAQTPADPRDAARLLVLDRHSGAVSHRIFRDIADLFSPGDALVLNDVNVIPARLRLKKPTGGGVRVLLLKRIPSTDPAGERWTALLTPSQKSGAALEGPEGLRARVEGVLPDGAYEMAFSREISSDLFHWGEMPLPPYIRRPAGDKRLEMEDRTFYQTVYARAAAADGAQRGLHAPGAVAAPTAGLHFTPELLLKIAGRGVHLVYLRLCVGWGTFRPVAGDDYKKHKMLPEEFDLSEAAAGSINAARAAGGKIWAVGTTTVRTLESLAGEDGRVRFGRGETDLFITPGHRFKAVDRLITNFHMPRYTPLLLAAAFAGAEPLRRAYQEAVSLEYRFFSYGDAMVVL